MKQEIKEIDEKYKYCCSWLGKLFRVILIGDYNAGKTTLFRRLLGLELQTQKIQTMRSLEPEKEADIEFKIFTYKGK